MISTHNYPTPQAPLSTGFGPRTTAQEAIGNQDLTDKIAIITGGYAGLGLETTKILAAAGATVIVLGRSQDKAQTALSTIPGVEFHSMDLMNPYSIDAFAKQYLESNRPIHLLINAAGIMANPLERDARGYESQLATNHLGHFQLSARLWPALKKANGARIVSVSSRAHQISDIDFEDLHFNYRPYDKFVAYGQSKTANALFAVEMDKRGRAHNVRAFSLHPGTIMTELNRHLSDDEMRAAGVLNEREERVLSELNDENKTIPEGTATIVWCATSPLLDQMGGVYCQRMDIAPVTDIRYAPGVFPWAINPANANRLWQVSEQLTNVTFDI